MQMAHEMRRLRAEHSALLTLARFLTEFIDAPQPPRATELAAVRGMLRDTLVRHLKCEDWALYPRLKASGDPALMELSSEFVGEMGHIADDFAAYDKKWTPAGIEAAWPDFCTETRAILAALGARIAREDRDLYPVAESINLRPNRAMYR